MKLIKILFSKIFISAFALVLQLLIFLTVLLAFETYFVWLQVISILFGFIIIIGIIEKKESPEFKAPWLVIILVLPFFGMVIYCLFANSKMSAGQFRKMSEITRRCAKYTKPTANEDEEIFASLKEYTGIENYLRKNADSRGYLNSRAVYFKSGEEFYADLLAELEKAEKFIFMEYFIIDRGKMWNGIYEILKRKAANGVEVRLMYDDIGCAGLIKNSYRKQMRRNGIICIKFNPFKPVISGIHNNRDHRKITVIDGKTGFTGGVNLADEYINEKTRFGHWKDTALKLQGGAVKNLTALFLQMFDTAAKKDPENIPSYDKYFNVDYGIFDDGGCIHPFGDGPKPAYKELVGANNYINIINTAKNYVYISTPYLIPDYNLTQALRSAAFRGVDVRIITPHIPDKKLIFNMTRSNYKYLLEAGVKIYEYTPGFIHAKGMVADGEIAFVGTINLDYRSLVHHYECGATLFNTPCIADIKADFDETLNLSQEITLENFKLSFAASVLNAVLNLFSPML